MSIVLPDGRKRLIRNGVALTQDFVWYSELNAEIDALANDPKRPSYAAELSVLGGQVRDYLACVRLGLFPEHYRDLFSAPQKRIEELERNQPVISTGRARL